MKKYILTLNTAILKQGEDLKELQGLCDSLDCDAEIIDADAAEVIYTKDAGVIDNA